MGNPDLYYEQMIQGERETDSSIETLARLSTLEASNREILDRYPADSVKAAIEAKLTSGKPRPFGRSAGHTLTILRNTGLAAAACLAIAVTIVGTLRTTGVETTPSQAASLTNRVKGDATRLFVYRKTGDSVLKLESGTHVSEKDILQISYVSAGTRWGFIFSVDGNGTVTQHYPDTGTVSAMLESGAEIPLPFSYELDNAPSFERFFLVSSFSSFNAEDFLSAITECDNIGNISSQTLAELVPENITVSDLVLYK